MTLETGFWRVDSGQKPTRITPSAMDFESRLEAILENDISIVSEPRKWLVIGKQVATDHGGRIDLLAIDESGNLVILELKRDRTDREVVSQTLDYAAWVSELDYARVAGVFNDYQAKKGLHTSLEEAFQAYFGQPIPEDVNASHEMVIVAAELHPESERVVHYLVDNYSVPINAVFFSFFKDGAAEYLSRAWLAEPSGESDGEPPKAPKRWNGEYYVSFGGYPRKVVEAGLENGFIVAGGGQWYSGSLGLLSEGDRVWVHLGSGKGFVGVGRVTVAKTPVEDFTVRRDGAEIPMAEVVPDFAAELLTDDADKVAYAVGVDWIHLASYDHGVWEKGFLANQNTVAQPTSPKWEYTVERLAALWGIDDV